MVRITYSFLVAWLVIATLSPVQAQDNQDKKNNVVASAKTTKTTPTGDYCIPADTPQIVSQCPSNAPKAAKKSGKLGSAAGSSAQRSVDPGPGTATIDRYGGLWPPGSRRSITATVSAENGKSPMSDV